MSTISTVGSGSSSVASERTAFASSDGSDSSERCSRTSSRNPASDSSAGPSDRELSSTIACSLSRKVSRSARVRCTVVLWSGWIAAPSVRRSSRSRPDPSASVRIATAISARRGRPRIAPSQGLRKRLRVVAGHRLCVPRSAAAADPDFREFRWRPDRGGARGAKAFHQIVQFSFPRRLDSQCSRGREPHEFNHLETGRFRQRNCLHSKMGNCED